MEIIYQMILGDFGKYWRECAHPEFLSEDLDDLINALLEIKKDKKY